MSVLLHEGVIQEVFSYILVCMLAKLFAISIFVVGRKTVFISACVISGGRTFRGCRHSKINTVNNFRSSKWCYTGKAETISYDLIAFIYSFNISRHMIISPKNATWSFAHINILGLSVEKISGEISIGPWTKEKKKKLKKERDQFIA